MGSRYKEMPMNAFQKVEDVAGFHDFEASPSITGIYRGSKVLRIQGKESRVFEIECEDANFLVGSYTLVSDKLHRNGKDLHVDRFVRIIRGDKVPGKSYFQFDVFVGPQAPSEDVPF